jgi:hypothetical protein
MNAVAARAITRAARRRTIANVRHAGGVDRTDGKVVSDMGRILSMSVRADRWRWPEVRARMSV